jgi:tetratricopeptide (TPR) repeat protein
MKKVKSNSTKTKKDLYSQISLGKRIIFGLFLFSIAVGILFLTEGILRLFNYGGDLRLFISAPEEVSNYFRCNPDIGNRYFYRQFTTPTPPKGLFLKEKPKNGYRIFVLGGSTTAGFPYANNLMFSRILWRRLQDAFPEKRVEVVNTAMSAINSYTLLDFTDEILEYKPDLILVYAGHNEFYGALGVGSLESIGNNRTLIKLYMKVQHLRVFRLLREIINRITSIFQKDDAQNPEDLTATLMERIVSEQIIPLGSDLYERGKKQFLSNMEEILQQAGKAKVPVVLSELVSNVGNQPPFLSVQSDTLPPADKIYQQAQGLEASGDYEKALRMYTWAKDLDALRFRAAEDFNAIIRELASKHKVPVVPMKQIFAEYSHHGIIGNELILEHLHPNVDGNFLMAEGFFQTLMAERYISPKWDSSRMKPSGEYKKNWGMTTLDTVYGNLSIRWLKGGWPFQPKEFHNTSLETYTPKNKIDSVALKILVDMGIGLEVGHLNLANYYREHKEYENAYSEYKALIYIIPHEIMFYEGAAEMLLELNKEKEAISILEESLLIRKNAFAIKYLARYYLQQGNVNKALLYLAKAESALTEDGEFLNTLAHTYIASGQFEKFSKTLKHISSRGKGTLQLLKYHPSAKTERLAEQYNSASLPLLKKQDFQPALVLLTQSLNIKETSKANKWIGQILLLEKQYNKALPCLKKAEAMGLKNADLYYNLAVANYYTDNKKETVRYLKKLKQVRPDHPDPSGLKDKLNLD